MKRIVWLVAASAVLASGCSDPKKASKGNFEAAIGDWIGKNPPCIVVPEGTVRPAKNADADYPRYVDASPISVKYALESRERQEVPLAALVDAGLMTVRDAKVSAKAGLFGDAMKDLPVHAYELSAAGKKAMSTAEAGLKAHSQLFCYGKPTVDEIVQYTEPADMMGMTVSRVSYRYHLADLPAWADNAKLKSAFPELERETAKSLDGKAAVVLTNEGWVHEKASALR